MAAEPRYRAGASRATRLKNKVWDGERLMARCDAEADAAIVAAALNAAEDVGRLRAAAQVVIDAADAASGIWIPLEQPLASLRQALKAEPKEVQ